MDSGGNGTELGPAGGRDLPQCVVSATQLEIGDRAGAGYLLLGKPIPRRDTAVQSERSGLGVGIMAGAGASRGIPPGPARTPEIPDSFIVLAPPTAAWTVRKPRM
ncbi:hypothetical protein JZ751_028212, partial [Albula glossodonta]